MREVRLQWLRPAEVVAERERCPIVYLPIGPLEWYGPHLPLGADPLQAEHIALELAQQVGGVAHPALYLGTERERSPELLRDLGFDGGEWIVGMDFPANTVRSPYYPDDAFALTARLTLDQLAAHGCRLIVIVNGHGATNRIAQLQRLAAEFSQRGPARVLYTFGLDAAVDDDAGHATLTETAAVMALNSERVDLVCCRPRTFPSPTRAGRSSTGRPLRAAPRPTTLCGQRPIHAGLQPRPAAAAMNLPFSGWRRLSGRPGPTSRRRRIRPSSKNQWRSL